MNAWSSKIYRPILSVTIILTLLGPSFVPSSTAYGSSVPDSHGTWSLVPDSAAPDPGVDDDMDGGPRSMNQSYDFGAIKEPVETPYTPAAELHVCDACTYTTVQAAVDAASDGDVIKVASGVYTGVQARTGVTQTVYISKSVTIQGGYTTTNWTTSHPDANPTTLDALGQGRVLYITGDISPTVEGLRITGGDADGLGGALWGDDAGGGLYVVTATATIRDNRVFNNVANYGGGLYLGSSPATLSGNTVTSNAGFWGGGGLFLYESAATLSGNTVTSNTADSGGGLGLYESDATLNGNAVSGNTAYLGGGLFVEDGAVMLNGNIVSANSGDYGSGLYLLYSDATLTNNVVADNQASSAGSGLYIEGSSPHLLHTTIARNSGGDGSGVYVTNAGSLYSTVALTNTILVSQTVGLNVGVDNTAILNGVLWHGNTADTGGAGAITVTHAYTGSPAFAADGYHLTAGSAAIDQGVDAGVESDIDGEPRPSGAAPDLGADEYIAAATGLCYAQVASTGATYDSVQAAVDATSAGDTVKVAGYCSGVQMRGGVTQTVYLNKSITIRGGYTTTNWITSDPIANPSTLDAQGRGRVLYITGNINPTVEGLRITGGNAAGLHGSVWESDAGGGIYVITATVTISTCQIFSNTASSGYGGGLYLDEGGGTLGGNTVFSNTATWGGGLYLSPGGATVLTGNTIISNTASSSAVSSQGGGLKLLRGDAALSGNIFRGNRADYGGGLRLDYCDATLSGNMIAHNIADQGGGLYLHQSHTTLSGNTVTTNTANQGGGLFMYFGADTLNENIFAANNAAWGGGLLLEASDAKLSENIVVRNNSSLYGGGLYLSASNAVLTNTVIARNQASLKGSGLYIADYAPRLLHTTIARNSGGDGSGVYLGGTSRATFTNTILVSQTVGFTATAASIATVNSVLWYGNTANIGGAGTVIVTNPYTGDPAFAADGYHLTSGSAAIDQGVNAGVNVDIDGEPRPMSVGYDLGADEFRTGCVPLTGVNIIGPDATEIGKSVMLGARPNPDYAAEPITYTWSPPPRFFTPIWFDAVYYWNTAGVYTVTATAENCGGTVTGAHRVTVTALRPAVCVEGIVRHGATPLPGVQVDLLAGTPNPIQTTTTDGNGRYRFCNLIPGLYQLKRYGPTSEYISSATTSVLVGNGSLVRNLDLPKKMTLLSPSDGATINTTIPTLDWQALPVAGHYTLQLNRTADWELVLQRFGLSSTSYQVESPLDKGTAYTWQIDAYTGTHWVGATTDAFEFTVSYTASDPSLAANLYAHLWVEDAPPGVVVNKLIGDDGGETDTAYVEIGSRVGTWDAGGYNEVNAILTVPDDRLGTPVNAWLRRDGTLTPLAYTNLGGGSYQVVTDLHRRCPFRFCSYTAVVVWRFRIPNTVSPQDLNLQLQVQMPGYTISGGTSEATLRLVRFPAAIIVTNRSLLYDHHSDYYVTRLLQKLYTVVQGSPYNEHPQGVVYYVDRYSDDVLNWDNTNIDYTSETTANEVADEIDDLIEDWVEDGSLLYVWPFYYWGPEYLLTVGDDDVIPFYRYDDPSNDEGITRFECDGNPLNGREHPGWCTDSNTNPAILTTDEDFFFTDNSYGDLWGGTDWQDGDLELAVGRIVGDSAADMLTLLNSSLATDGDTGRAVMASVDGWELGTTESPSCGSGEIDDVLDVPNRLVARGFDVRNDTETPHTVDVLSPYPANWNAGFRTAANGGMDIFFIGGHDHYDHASIPGDDFSPDDTCAAAPCDYHRFDDDHPLAFIVGCHGGLTVPDVDVPGGVDHDMVYDLAHEGARAYVGATGFSYGSPRSLCYTTFGERLMQHFFDEFLPTGSRSRPIGEALRRAKDNYVFGFGGSGALDRKTATEFNLYGVPWQRLDYPGGTAAATAVHQMARPSAVTRQVGPTVQADTFRYTRTITVEIASFDAVTTTQEDITYDILSIPGGGMAVAPDLPMLPYVEGYTLTLPLSGTVQGVTLTHSTCADVGPYEVSIIVAQPWTEGGTTYTTTTDITTLYPPDDGLVQWQQQGERMLFTLFPIQHNPTSNETRFCSQMVLQMAYDAPLPLAISDLQPQAERLAPGETITATALVENVGDDLATITTTLTLMDAHGNTVGWQDGGPFSIMAGGQEDLSFSWDGFLNEGAYALGLTLWQDGQAVGLAASKINVVGGALTSLEAPTTTVMPGEQAIFRVTFANYLDTPVTATVRLVIYDENGHPVEELSPQSDQVGGQDEATFTLNWQPGGATGTLNWQPGGTPGGAYTAWALVEKEDETTYGPAVQTFQVGYNLYLPLVLRNE